MAHQAVATGERPATPAIAPLYAGAGATTVWYFDTNTETEPLPPCAVRCCRSAAQHDHALAQAQLRSSRGSHNRNQKSRAARLDAASKRAEACSRDLARESR